MLLNSFNNNETNQTNSPTGGELLLKANSPKF